MTVGSVLGFEADHEVATIARDTYFTDYDRLQQPPWLYIDVGAG